MENSMVVFAFSVLVRKHPLWANLSQKIKIVSLSWNLLPRLIEYVEFNGYIHFFYFRTETPFLGKLVQKINLNLLNCQFKLEFGT